MLFEKSQLFSLQQRKTFTLVQEFHWMRQPLRRPSLYVTNSLVLKKSATYCNTPESFLQIEQVDSYGRRKSFKCLSPMLCRTLNYTQDQMGTHKLRLLEFLRENETFIPVRKECDKGLLDQGLRNTISYQFKIRTNLEQGLYCLIIPFIYFFLFLVVGGTAAAPNHTYSKIFYFAIDFHGQLLFYLGFVKLSRHAYITKIFMKVCCLSTTLCPAQHSNGAIHYSLQGNMCA